jgi:hypothetical protein
MPPAFGESGGVVVEVGVTGKVVGEGATNASASTMAGLTRYKVNICSRKINNRLIVFKS